MTKPAVCRKCYSQGQCYFSLALRYDVMTKNLVCSSPDLGLNVLHVLHNCFAATETLVNLANRVG